MSKRVVAFAGPPGCGKSTAASFLWFHITNDNSVNKMFSTAVVVEMSAFLKRSLCHLFGVPELLTLFDNDKEEPQKALNGMSFRKALIKFSEESIKPVWGEDFFGRVMAARALRTAEDVFIIPGIGFIEEATALIDAFGVNNVLIVEIEAKVNNNELTFENDSRSYFGDELQSIRRKAKVRRIKNYITDNDPSFRSMFKQVVIDTWESYLADD